MLITRVNKFFPGDAYFPEIDTELWKEVTREDIRTDDPTIIAYSFIKYARRTNVGTPNVTELVTLAELTEIFKEFQVDEECSEEALF